MNRRLLCPRLPLFRVLAAFALLTPAFAQDASRADWGAPLVHVAPAGTTWTVAGQKNTFTLNASDLTLTVQAGGATWRMVPSGARDLEIKAGDESCFVRLADAGKIAVAPYDTGAETGVKLTLDQWKRPGGRGAPIMLPLYLTLAFAGRDEELVFSVAADESHGAVVRQLDWPTALDGREVDFTVLNHYRGILLPRANLTSIDSTRAILDRMTALHRRVALLDMTGHEFLDANHQKERTTFADGTTVTVDWKARTVKIEPEVKVGR